MLKGETAAGIPVTSAETKRATHRRIDILDSYRALAILFVLSFHYTVRWAAPEDPAQHLAPGAIFDPVTPLGYGALGVEFFFMISGFVILMTLERCRNVGDFALRRFARLWPALLIGATLTTAIVAWLGPADWQVSAGDYFTSVTLIDPSITSWLTHRPGLKWVDGAYWSLWIELCFYAWAAAVYLLVRKRFVVAWLGLFALLLIGMVFSGWHIPAFIVDFLNKTHLARPIQLVASFSSRWLAPYLFISHFPYFTVGICAYEIWSNGRFRKVAIGGIAVAAALTSYWALTGKSVFVNAEVIDVTIINTLMFSLFILFTFDHRLVRIFNFRPLVLVGQASYSLYLLHQNIGIAVMRRGIASGVPYLLMLPLTVLAMIGLALSIFQFVEIPAKAWLLARAPRIVAAIDRYLPGLSYESIVGS